MKVRIQNADAVREKLAEFKEIVPNAVEQAIINEANEMYRRMVVDTFDRSRLAYHLSEIKSRRLI